MGATPKLALPYPEATGAVMNGYDNIADLATAVETILTTTTAYTPTKTDAPAWNVTSVVVRRVGPLVQIRGVVESTPGNALDDLSDVGNVSPNELVCTFSGLPAPIMQTAVTADGAGRLAGFTLIANGSTVELTLTAVSTRVRNDAGGMSTLYPGALSFSGIYLTAAAL